MGWGFRRSLKLGPLRLNFSKSGVGYSIGAKGFRVGQNARGRSYTAASIPGTGLYDREYLDNPHPQAALATGGAGQLTAASAAQPARPSSTQAAQWSGFGLALLFCSGILVGMFLMGPFASKPIPVLVTPPIAQIVAPTPVAPKHPAKRRIHHAHVPDSKPVSTPLALSPD